MVFLAALAATCSTARAQELEPRAYSHTPVGMNFLIAGYGYTEGDVLLEASSPVQDAELELHTSLLGYARTLNLFGDTAKFDVIIPYGWASGSASLAGQPRERDVNGFGDPALRFTWNFIGAPAMTLAQIREHPPSWIVGASFRLGMPLGQYDNDKLLNLGANRWSFKPELGASKTWGRWTVEIATAVTFYTDNEEFLGDGVREQDPIFAVQGHAIYSLGRGIWVGLDGTYYEGGETTLNGTVNDDRQSSSRVGLTLAVPLSYRQSLKLYGSMGATARIGGDFNTVGIAWQYRWGGGLSEVAPIKTKEQL